MNRISFRKLCIGCLVCLAVALLAAAQTSPSYDLSWWTLSGGGATRHSASAVVTDAIGQTACEVSTSANVRIESGFIPGLPDPAPPEPGSMMVVF